MLNYNTKRINPKFLLLIILFIACILTFKNYINFTYCLQYQIAECPDGLSLSTYGIEAETDDEAIQKVKEILNNNNLNSDNYIITITDNNLIKIEAGQTGETQAETSEENYIIEENPEGGISLLIDYTASKKITTTSGEEIYIPEEILQYKYIFINRSSNINSYYFYAANEIEYITGT